MKINRTCLILIVILLIIPLNVQCSGKPELRILFIGNSYTFYNQLPGAFQALAESGGHITKTSMIAKGGYTLRRHSENPSVLDKIRRGNWDYVILQEQSVVPTVDYQYADYMVPAISIFEKVIRESGARPVLFMTWGRENGIEKYGHKNFHDMQEKLYAAYMEVGHEFQITVAPVGMAWKQVHEEHLEIDLWLEDGSHPSQTGTYLAACVFYCILFQENPVGLEYPKGIISEVAYILQESAAQITLEQIDHWQIGN